MSQHGRALRAARLRYREALKTFEYSDGEGMHVIDATPDLFGRLLRAQTWFRSTEDEGVPYPVLAGDKTFEMLRGDVDAMIAQWAESDAKATDAYSRERAEADAENGGEARAQEIFDET